MTAARGMTTPAYTEAEDALAQELAAQDLAVDLAYLEWDDWPSRDQERYLAAARIALPVIAARTP